METLSDTYSICKYSMRQSDMWDSPHRSSTIAITMPISQSAFP